MRKIRLRVSYSTRPVSAKVLGNGQTESSESTKRDGIKKLRHDNDRVPRKGKKQ